MTLSSSVPRIATYPHDSNQYHPSYHQASAHHPVHPSYYSSSAPSSSSASSSSSAAMFSTEISAMSRHSTGPLSAGSKKAKEEVWPEAVENAFMTAIREIPKLGRRKVPLHEKHYGRNELIAAYILKETQQKRSRKQVSSHIQVLKNTRKEDFILMELLSDASPDENNDPEWLEAAMVKIRKIFDEDSLQNMPPSPLSPTEGISEKFERLSSRGFRDEEKRPTHNRQLSIASILNPEPEDNEQVDGPTKDLLVEGSPKDPQVHPFVTSSSPSSSSRGERSWMAPHHSQHVEYGSNTANHSFSAWSPNQSDYDAAASYRSGQYPFWPCQYKMTMQEPALRGYDSPSHSSDRELVVIRNDTPFHDHISCQDINMLDDARFPILRPSFYRKRCLFLRTRLGLNLEGPSQRTHYLSSNMFQSREMLTVQCSTTVYSFGKEIVRCTETRQASWHLGRFVYQFKMVDEWMQEYLHTLREGSIEEMESSLQNMTIVQEFSSLVVDENSPEDGTTLEPVLVVAYEFYPGNGSSASYRLTTGPPTASVRARSNTWDHPMPTPMWNLSYNQGTGPWATTPGARLAKRSSLELESEWPPQPKRFRNDPLPAFAPYP